MDNYTDKTRKLLKKFVSYFATQNFDEEFKSEVMSAFDKRFKNCTSEQFEENTFADLRMVLLKDGEIERIFPVIPTANKQEFDKSHEMIKNFVAFEASFLTNIFKKEDFKFENIREFVSFTYRPPANTTGHPALLATYFIVSVFIMKNGKMEYTVKPNIQYVLTKENTLDEATLLKLL